MFSGDFASAVRDGFVNMNIFVMLRIGDACVALRCYYLFLSSAFFIYLGGCAGGGGGGGVSGGSGVSGDFSFALRDLALDSVAGSRVGDKLQVSLAGWDDVDDIRYQWLRDGIEIEGEDSFSYRLSSMDIGLGLRVRIIYSAGFGDREVMSDIFMVTDTEGNLVIDDSEGVVFGSRLRVKVDDPDNFVEILSHRWLRDGVETGYDMDTYVVTFEDLGSVIGVDGLYRDGFGDHSFTISGVPTVNTGGIISIDASGGLGVGDDLGVDFVDVDLTPEQMGNVVYQWLRDGVDIVGAMGSSYTIMPEDIGNEVGVKASYSDSFGKHEIFGLGIRLFDTLGSLDFSLLGAARVGEILDVLVSDDDIVSDAIEADSYEWFRDGVAIAGETMPSYTITSEDSGKSVSVRVIYRDAFGYHTLTLGVSTDDTEGSISIDDSSGVELGDELVLDFVDPDNVSNVEYEWFRGDEISGETMSISDDMSTYTITVADAGASISVRALYDDGFGDGHVVESSVIRVALASVDTEGIIDLFPRGGVVARVGVILDVSVSDDDIGGKVTENVSYEWLRDGKEIDGETSSTYRITSLDSGKSVSVSVIYEDDFGSHTLTSSIVVPIAPIVPIVPIDTEGTISIDGSADASIKFRVGDELVLEFADVDLTSEQEDKVEYQWFRGDDDIMGATGSSYILTVDDAGFSIGVRALYDDGFGEHDITSDSVLVVDSAGRLFIYSLGMVGDILDSELYDSDIGDGAIEANSYQWLRAGEEIGGETSSTYTITSEDSGFGLSVRVMYDDVFDSYTLTSSELVTVDTTGTISIAGFADASIKFRVGDELVLEFADVDLTSEQEDKVEYQWLRDGVEITDETMSITDDMSTYTITAADAGASISVRALYDDGFGKGHVVESSAIMVALASVDTAILEFCHPFSDFRGIKGSTWEVCLFEDDVGIEKITDNVSYKWFSDGVAIDGALSNSYTLTDDDEMASIIRVEAIYRDSFDMDTTFTVQDSPVSFPSPVFDSFFDYGDLF